MKTMVNGVVVQSDEPFSYVGSDEAWEKAMGRGGRAISEDDRRRLGERNTAERYSAD